MKKEVIVMSLGGSLIIPEEVDINFLKSFKKTILRNTKNHKFVIVCGGGSIARKYISALREEGMDEKLQSFSGISATRMNARFMNYFFNKNPEYGIPHTTEEVASYLKKHDIVFCGALEYKPNQTSDSTSAQLAKKFKTIFINLTNVKGLYTKNPKKYKNAKFIPEINWKEFDKLANASKYQPGQHFVLDQTASKIIMKSKITTYIIGQDMEQLENVLKGKKFEGTLVNG
ncbi:MAG: UMP kinase [Nanoarchaeota archaeon]|nr:UMP kinase [Nanoarchaeota archaeon]